MSANPESVQLGLDEAARANESEATDFELTSRVAGGDRNAWRALFERHGDFVFAIAYRFFGNAADARDVLQDVFVALFEEAHRYRPGGAFRGYLRRLVVNRCLNEQGRAHRRLRVDLDPGDERLADAGEKEPHSLLEAKQATQVVRAAILALPERQRMGVLLSRYEGASYEEIAAALGCSVASVESLLFRARRSLAKALAGA